VDLGLLDAHVETKAAQLVRDQRRDGVLAGRGRAMLDRGPALDALAELSFGEELLGSMPRLLQAQAPD
jgi:hypothetical protein